jgi:CRISPR-associated endonuclease/helicase Cas3
MRESGHNVLHLSTALCPRDRDAMLSTIRGRLKPEKKYPADWTLVATSLMEAGVDVSFRTPFRERFATTSIIQIGGRGNRNFEWPDGVTVHDFVVSFVEGLKDHPAARVSANVLAEFFEKGRFEGTIDAADLVTLAMRREIKLRSDTDCNALLQAERGRCYPDVAKLGRVIDTDTRLVVVDRLLRDRIVARDRLSMREILNGSVQIWAHKINKLGLECLVGRQEIYWWPHDYDPTFLGYMQGALRLDAISAGDALIV